MIVAVCIEALPSKAAEHRILLSRSARCRLSADVEDGTMSRAPEKGGAVLPTSMTNIEKP